MDMTNDQRRAAIAEILHQWPIEELALPPEEPDEEINPYDHLFDAEIV
jgi:hypothetical protein